MEFTKRVSAGICLQSIFSDHVIVTPLITRECALDPWDWTEIYSNINVSTTIRWAIYGELQELGFPSITEQVID